MFLLSMGLAEMAWWLFQRAAQGVPGSVSQGPCGEIGDLAPSPAIGALQPQQKADKKLWVQRQGCGCGAGGGRALCSPPGGWCSVGPGGPAPAGGCAGGTARRCAPSRAAPDCLWHSSVAAKQQLRGEHLSRASCGQRAAISGCGAAGGCAEGGGSRRGPDPRGWELHGAPRPWQGGGGSPLGSWWRMLGSWFWCWWC